MIKFVADGRFIWTMVKEGRVQAAAGGRYALEKDNKYSETIEYVHGDGLESMVRKTFNFTWKIDDR
jgi:hypothetical protein